MSIFPTAADLSSIEEELAGLSPADRKRVRREAARLERKYKRWMADPEARAWLDQAADILKIAHEQGPEWEARCLALAERLGEQPWVERKVIPAAKGLIPWDEVLRGP